MKVRWALSLGPCSFLPCARRAQRASSRPAALSLILRERGRKPRGNRHSCVARAHGTSTTRVSSHCFARDVQHGPRHRMPRLQKGLWARVQPALGVLAASEDGGTASPSCSPAASSSESPTSSSSASVPGTASSASGSAAVAGGGTASPPGLDDELADAWAPAGSPACCMPFIAQMSSKSRTSSFAAFLTSLRWRRVSWHI